MAALMVAVVILGVVDSLEQRRRRRERLKMDREELKKEFRESEGDPELMGLRKQMHRELLMTGMLQSVRKAKVVVVDRLKKHRSR